MIAVESRLSLMFQYVNSLHFIPGGVLNIFQDNVWHSQCVAQNMHLKTVVIPVTDCTSCI